MARRDGAALAPRREPRTPDSVPALCCLHGLFGTPDHFVPLAALLAGRRRVLAPALPLTLEASREGVPALSRFVAAWLSARGVDRAVVVGNSLGGHVALDFALRYPARAAALVLSGSAGLLERGFTRAVPRSPSAAFVRSRVEEVFFDPALATEALVRSVQAFLADRWNGRTVVGWARATRAQPMAGRLGEVRAPALLVWGEEDRVTPIHVARAFLAGLPDARLVTLPRCGHVPMLEAPRRFGAAVAAFLDEVDGRTAPAPVAAAGDHG